jgi:hypothetical protein
LIDAGVPDIQDRHPGLQMQVPAFAGVGHAGADFLAHPDHGVALVFQHPVDAIGVRDLGLQQPRPFSDGPRDIGGDPVHRVIIGVEDVLPPQHRLGARGHLEPRGDLGRRLDTLDAQYLKPAAPALLGTFQQERREPAVAVLG